jgi:hypothetical protein
VNSEELEISLRTEFESYLKDVFAAMKQDVANFQKNFEAEFEKHRSQMDEGFRTLSQRFGSEVKLDKAFTESVVEHLSLARDDGAQLSANAFDEAQKLEGASAHTNADLLRDAINDISSQTTQSAILKSLVEHVSMLTPRGAFFIVKNDTLVCWRRFDRMGNFGDDSVREINFSLSADTLLADAVRSLAVKDNASAQHGDDEVYLNALGFGRAERMFAVPLIARGRGVAVLYVDSGSENERVHLEAIESLVRVAGLTVELRAASSVAQTGVQEPSYVPMQPAKDDSTSASEAHEPEHSETSYEPVEAAAETHSPQPEFAEYTGAVAVEEPEPEPVAPETHFAEVEAAPAENEAYFEPVAEVEPEVAEPESGYGDIETSESMEPEKVSDFAFASSNAYDASAEPVPEPVEEYAYAGETPNGSSNGHSYEAAPEPVVEVAAAQPAKPRLSDRHVDLPIEVSEDERRLHNDARRFARLLVSEIKLYNEQKVNEGRGSSDLYDRLREAIDRSREMYDKRVQPQVAAKFDYFHYELVSNLAEGNDAKLGTSYPGAVV